MEWVWKMSFGINVGTNWCASILLPAEREKLKDICLYFYWRFVWCKWHCLHQNRERHRQTSVECEEGADTDWLAAFTSHARSTWYGLCLSNNFNISSDSYVCSICFAPVPFYRMKLVWSRTVCLYVFVWSQWKRVKINAMKSKIGSNSHTIKYLKWFECRMFWFDRLCLGLGWVLFKSTVESLRAKFSQWKCLL